MTEPNEPSVNEPEQQSTQPHNEMHTFSSIIQSLFRNQNSGATGLPSTSFCCQCSHQHENTDDECHSENRNDDTDEEEDGDDSDEWTCMLRLLESHNKICDSFLLMIRNRYEDNNE